MSLRRRLMLVLGIALFALIAASVAIVQAIADSDSVRLSNAEASGHAASLALARAYPEHVPSRDAGLRHDAEAERALRPSVTSVLRPVVDTVGGYCWKDGFLLEEFGPNAGPTPLPAGASPEEPRKPNPPPDVRALLDQECAKATTGHSVSRQMVRKRSTMVIVVTGVDDGVAAFTVRGVPHAVSRGPFGPSVQLGAMALLTLAMVAVMMDAMFALRRGATALEETLGRLENDLRAEITLPRATELSSIAARLRQMAWHLADAHDRERALERRVAHEARLAALGRLVGGVAHEIRNPLTGIKLLLDGIARRDGDGRTRDDATAALGEIARLDNVVTSLLGVARDARSEPSMVDLRATAEERLSVAAELASSKGIAVTTTGVGQARLERDVLVGIVDNLIRNAIEAAPDGGVIEAVVGMDGHQARIDVVDAGPGVPGAREGELFEPFFTTKPDGNGLGLWLSRALASARGGSLEYRRENDRTHFTLRLPGR